ncbi:MAG: 50S ribosomal protein L25 [Flavobacteriales bacterium]|nr:50S ribosomal protein L25 [Flavobacteriales bacterium]
MESISITGSVRKSLGKADAKVLRREGLVPCIIYGGAENIHFQVDERAFNKLINTPYVYIVNVEVDGKTYSTVIKDTQFHPLTDRVIHVDFQLLAPGKPVKLSLPINTEGVSRGVLNGGKLQQVLRRAKVSGVPAELPDFITIDISKLKIGQSVKVKDMKIRGVKFMENENQILVSIKAKRGAKLDDAADEAEDGEATPAESIEAAAE